jgi:hypothetical protein
VWESAEQLAREYGVHPVASTLRLNYERLKGRVAAGAKTPSAASAPLFVELEPGGPKRQPECLIELEDRAGQKMTIRLGSANGLDIAGLTATFWRRRR